MTIDRADSDVAFAWDEKVRGRVERRAQEIRRRRRKVFGTLGGISALVCLGALVATLTLSGPSGVNVATTAPDPTAELAQLLPTSSSVTAVIPQLRLRPVSSGRDYGVPTPTEMLGAHGAVLGVDRQWVTGTGSVQLQPGQPFPDEVFTVIGTIIRFDNPVDAEAWTRQLVAHAGTPLSLPGTGASATDLVALRTPGDLAGQLRYIAVFTDGDTAFSLEMVAGGSGGHDSEFVRLVQDWSRRR